MKIFRLTLLLLLATINTETICQPYDVRIARDSFGVPHVFGKTDADAAYGLAWAHAEDDFKSLQQVILPIKGLLGRYQGKSGARADYVVELLRCRELVDEQWHTLAPDFVRVMEGYVNGLNRYAATHKREVLVAKAFPVTTREYTAAVVAAVAVFRGADRALTQIYNHTIATVNHWDAHGSNALAVHASKTETGEAFLAINAHQPNEGPLAFYEAHVASEDGWNMLGGLLPGSCVIGHGTNEHLGWAHTVNNPDGVDVYQLKMNPANKNHYEYDGAYKTLDEKTVRLKVKGVPITVKRKAYSSVHGPVVKTAKGVFALRMSALMTIGAMQQWYRMNKARNFTEFRAALQTQGLSMFNIMYADRFDTIYYVSNALMPDRNVAPAANWASTLPGSSSQNLWTKLKPFDSLPQYINPAAGFLYNTNHSPFRATAKEGNLNPSAFDPKDGFELFDNNRSVSLLQSMPLDRKLSYDSFKQIKYSHRLPKQLHYNTDVSAMYEVSAANYPHLGDVISSFQQWDKNATAESVGAGAFAMTYYFLADSMRNLRKLNAEQAVRVFQHIKNYQLRWFGKTGVTLGEFQQLSRGNKQLPSWGIPDVLTAMWAAPAANGRRRVAGGDGYIAFVRYPKLGLPIIESVNCYGASARPESPHYTSQMEMFMKQQTKKMTLDKELVLKQAVRVYRPG